MQTGYGCRCPPARRPVRSRGATHTGSMADLRNCVPRFCVRSVRDTDDRADCAARSPDLDRKSTRLNSSHGYISYAVFCLKKKNQNHLVLLIPLLLHTM